MRYETKRNEKVSCTIALRARQRESEGEGEGDRESDTTLTGPDNNKSKKIYFSQQEILTP